MTHSFQAYGRHLTESYRLFRSVGCIFEVLSSNFQPLVKYLKRNHVIFFSWQDVSYKFRTVSHTSLILGYLFLSSVADVHMGGSCCCQQHTTVLKSINWITEFWSANTHLMCEHTRGGEMESEIKGDPYLRTIISRVNSDDALAFQCIYEECLLSTRCTVPSKIIF